MRTARKAKTSNSRFVAMLSIVAALYTVAVVSDITDERRVARAATSDSSADS